VLYDGAILPTVAQNNGSGGTGGTGGTGGSGGGGLPEPPPPVPPEDPPAPPHVETGDGRNNTLHAGPGVNILTGGRGADTFVFDSADGTTRINDFHARENDKIDLSHIVNFDPLHDHIRDFIDFSTAHGRNGGVTLSVDVNGTSDGAHFISLATLAGAHATDETAILNHIVM
jgi:hypothetical protein